MINIGAGERLNNTHIVCWTALPEVRLICSCDLFSAEGDFPVARDWDIVRPVSDVKIGKIRKWRRHTHTHTHMHPAAANSLTPNNK